MLPPHRLRELLDKIKDLVRNGTCDVELLKKNKNSSYLTVCGWEEPEGPVSLIVRIQLRDLLMLQKEIAAEAKFL
jgi:hypothetical protein